MPDVKNLNRLRLSAGRCAKASTGFPVVYAGNIVQLEVNDAGEDPERSIPLLKSTVFEIERNDGRPFTPTAVGPVAPIEAAEVFIERCGSEFHHGDDLAFYSTVRDRIHLPPIDQFINADGCTATNIHELTRWTGR